MLDIEFPDKLFVSGTDTEIGKTLVSSMLMCGLDATYWKPVQAGLEEETDTQRVARLSEKHEECFIPERYRLNTPMSPHASADIDEVVISLDDFELPEYKTKHLIVEGAGGLIVPLNWKDMVIDLIKKMDIPVLLVARSTLGTLNHTLLSVEALRKRDIEIFGIIMSGPKHESNRETLAHITGLPVYELLPMDEITNQSLKQQFSDIFQHAS